VDLTYPHSRRDRQHPDRGPAPHRGASTVNGRLTGGGRRGNDLGTAGRPTTLRRIPPPVLLRRTRRAFSGGPTPETGMGCGAHMARRLARQLVKEKAVMSI